MRQKRELCIAVGIYRISEKKIVYFQILQEYTCTYCLILLYKRSNKESDSNMLISRFKFIDYSYFNSCSIFTPITQIAKSPVCELAETII